MRGPRHNGAPGKACVNFATQLGHRSREQALGLSYVPPEVDEGWGGRIISQSGIPIAGQKKTPHMVFVAKYCGALLAGQTHS